MKKLHAFALLDVLLAVILLAIVTAGGYALMKNFRSTSSMQQFTRYATTITENYMPFLDGSVDTEILSGTKLSKEFLESINIPEEDLNCNSDDYCSVKTGLYYTSSQAVCMNFSQVRDSATGGNFFLIGFSGTIAQKDQAMKSLGSMFSVFCKGNISQKIEDDAGLCNLSSSASTSGISVVLVFPKSGDSLPAGTEISVCPPVNVS